MTTYTTEAGCDQHKRNYYSSILLFILLLHCHTLTPHTLSYTSTPPPYFTHPSCRFFSWLTPSTSMPCSNSRNTRARSSSAPPRRVSSCASRFVCLSVRPSVRLSVRLSYQQLLCPCASRFVRPSARPPVRFSYQQSLCLLHLTNNHYVCFLPLTNNHYVSTSYYILQC